MNLGRVLSRFMPLMDLLFIMLGVFMLFVANPDMASEKDSEPEIIILHAKQSESEKTDITLKGRNEAVINTMSQEEFSQYLVQHGITDSNLYVVVLYDRHGSILEQQAREDQLYILGKRFNLEGRFAYGGVWKGRPR